MDADLDALVEKLTLEEKVSLLSGASMWQTPAIERLGIPAVRIGCAGAVTRVRSLGCRGA